jgi:hypothetical protein
VIGFGLTGLGSVVTDVVTERERNPIIMPIATEAWL